MDKSNINVKNIVQICIKKKEVFKKMWKVLEAALSKQYGHLG